MLPTIDPQAIAALRDLNPEDPAFVRELIDVFLADMPLRFAEIEQALAGRNGNLLMRAAHTIRGSCGNFGALALASAASALEEQAKSGAYAEAAAGFPALRREFELVAQALQQYR